MEDQKYEFSDEQNTQLTAQDQTALVRAFDKYDDDKSHYISKEELKQILRDIGYTRISMTKVQQLIGKQDLNDDGELSWEEFVNLMIGNKGYLDSIKFSFGIKFDYSC